MRRQGFRVGLLIAVVCLFVPGISGAAGTRHTLSKQLTYWSNDGINGDQNECTTTSSPLAAALGGTECYFKSVTVPSDSNTLLVDVGAFVEMDSEDPNGVNTRSLEAVTVDGAACILGSASDYTTTTLPTGWLNLTEDDTNNGLATSYPWCCKVTPGSHGVALKIASFDGNEVEMSQISVTIDSGFYPAGSRCDFVPND